jgi:hypothetical protein
MSRWAARPGRPSGPVVPGASGFSVACTGGAKLPSAQADLPVFRFRMARSRRSCVSLGLTRTRSLLLRCSCR